MAHSDDVRDVVSRLELHRPEWHCPTCGVVLTEAEGGMECPEHGHITWAQLRATEWEE